MSEYRLTHLRQLEAESIHIIRETVAEFANPVMLYSIGKDSSVMVHLARKAFRPGRLPFSLLHVDTTFKFAEMYEFRDQFVREIGAELIVHSNRKALAEVGGPENWTCTACANLLKTAALVEALTAGGYDAALGGARRDEEKSRAKERVFSFRGSQMQWDPKGQRAEMWNLFNARCNKGESFRVFPLSNWTEQDVWQYIALERIPIVPLYFAKPREIVHRDGMMLLNGGVIQARPGERVETVLCRFRTLGCQLCTGAILSDADTIEKIVQETMLAVRSERQNRAVDQDREGSMEEKKREGYF